MARDEHVCEWFKSGSCVECGGPYVAKPQRDPLVTRGEKLQIVQREIEAQATRTMPGPSLAVCIVDALRDAEDEARSAHVSAHVAADSQE